MDTKKYSDFDRDVESRLIRVEDKLDALNQRIEDALIQRMQSHEERITSLEHWRVWVVGMSAGVSGLVGFLIHIFAK